MEICPTCDNEYQKIGTHWQWNPEHRPSMTKRQIELLKGVLMGDGCIQQGRGERKPSMDICVIEEDFLKFLDKELGVFSTGVTLRRTAEELKEQSQGIEYWEDSTFSDQYRLLTRAHPDLQQLSDWYESGEKAFPSDLELTPTALKMWFVTDGNNGRDSVRITATNEQENKDKLTGFFDDIGIKTTWSDDRNIRISWDSLDDFFDYIGEPVPGYEYKWPQ